MLGTCWLIGVAAASDSKTTMARPVSSFHVQKPWTNPGAWDTRGTTTSRRFCWAASRLLTVTLTTTACTLISLRRSGSLDPGSVSNQNPHHQRTNPRPLHRHRKIVLMGAVEANSDAARGGRGAPGLRP